jgi:hypothetical protein
MKVLLAALLVSLPMTASAAPPLTLGWAERVRLHPGGIEIAAKLDTGAVTSSLSAEDIEIYRHDGAAWVRFDVATGTGGAIRLERPLVRTMLIKDRGVRSRRRPVVSLGICVGTLYREVEVNLVDHSHFDYPMLIGRGFLSQGIAVDPARQFTTAPDCKDAPER